MKLSNLIIASAFVLSTGAFADEAAQKATGEDSAAAAQTQTVEKTEKTVTKKAKSAKKHGKKSSKKEEAPKAE